MKKSHIRNLVNFEKKAYTYYYGLYTLYHFKAHFEDREDFPSEDEIKAFIKEFIEFVGMTPQSFHPFIKTAIAYVKGKPLISLPTHMLIHSFGREELLNRLNHTIAHLTKQVFNLYIIEVEQKKKKGIDNA